MVRRGDSVWECSFEDFLDKVSIELREQQIENNIRRGIISTAAGFLTFKFENKEMKYSVESEVRKAIGEASIYHVNYLGEDF